MKIYKNENYEKRLLEDETTLGSTETQFPLEKKPHWRPMLQWGHAEEN